MVDTRRIDARQEVEETLEIQFVILVRMKIPVSFQQFGIHGKLIGLTLMFPHLRQMSLEQIERTGTNAKNLVFQDGDGVQQLQLNVI